MTNLEVTFLGTGASWPTVQRGMSALAIKRGAETLLFDCGEGTQRQLQRSGLSYQSITKIWLSHYHGDHCYGVPGLIKTMALNERDKPLDIYGPKGLRRMVDAWRQMGGWTRQFSIQVHEVAPGDVVDCGAYIVECHEGEHSVHNIAFALQEKERPGKFDKPKALAMGIPEGRMFGQLQRGQSVTLDDGTIVQPEEILGTPRPGRRVVFSGDTQPCAGILQAALGADLFICEASFTRDLMDRAREVKHMCAFEAASIAKDAKVRQLVLTHISPRYKDPAEVHDEAAAIFPAVTVAEDLMQLDIPYPSGA